MRSKSATSLNLSEFTGTVGQINEFLEQNPGLFPEMFREMLHNPKAAVRLRLGNAVEKAARKDPALLTPFKAELLAAISEKQETEVIWHLALLLGYLPLQEDDLAAAVNSLYHWLDTISHKFVKINCLQSLAILAQNHDWLRPEVIQTLQAALEHESPAIRARARILLKLFKPAKR